MAGNRCRCGFTLIELLVVVAIIAVLVAILLPALQSAREQGQRIVCASQLKQIYMGVTSYVEDHDGVFPLTWERDASMTWWIWFETINRDYLNGKDVMFRCPAQDSGWDFYQLIDAPEISYGWNYRLGRYVSPPGVSEYHRRAEVTRPTDLVLVGETDGRGIEIFRGYLVNEIPTSYLFAIRHQGGGNIAWVDGHVDYRTFDEVTGRTEWFDPAQQ